MRAESHIRQKKNNLQSVDYMEQIELTSHIDGILHCYDNHWNWMSDLYMPGLLGYNFLQRKFISYLIIQIINYISFIVICVLIKN